MRDRTRRGTPKIIIVELVNISKRFPFQEDFIKGSSTALVTPESRAKSQLCIIGEYIQSHGHLSLLRTLWARISSSTNCEYCFPNRHLRHDLFRISDVLFQVIFQYFFNSAMEDFEEPVATEQFFSIEFEDIGTNRFVSIRFWNGQTLCRIFVCRSSLPFSKLTEGKGFLVPPLIHGIH